MIAFGRIEDACSSSGERHDKSFFVLWNRRSQRALAIDLRLAPIISGESTRVAGDKTAAVRPAALLID